MVSQGKLHLPQRKAVLNMGIGWDVEQIGADLQTTLRRSMLKAREASAQSQTLLGHSLCPF